MLHSGDAAQQELILWLLSNCTADSPELGKLLIEKLDFLGMLRKIAEQAKVKVEALKVVLWNVENLARHRTIKSEDLLGVARLCTACLKVDDSEVQRAALATIRLVTDTANEKDL